MTAAPVVRWAIKYVNKDRPDYVDHMTVSYLRREAWKRFESHWNPERAKRMRRKREVVAVRVEIREATE